MFEYPNTNFHELNLDWIIETIKKLEAEINDFTAFNKITWRGSWDITKQYPAYSIVDVNNDGYVSLKPVPAGVDITNEEYWVMVANYSAIFADFQERLALLERTSVKTFETVAAMKSEQSLALDQIVKTLGYYNAGTGAAVYKITNDTSGIRLDNGLFASIQVDDEINLSQIGFKENDDLYDYILTACSLINKKGIIHIPADAKAEHQININLDTEDLITIDGHEHKITATISSGSVFLFTASGYGYNVNLKNLTINGHHAPISGLRFNNFTSSLNRNEISNVIITDCTNGIVLNNSRMFNINNYASWNNERGINFYCSAASQFNGDCEIINSQFVHDEHTGNGIVLNAPTSAENAGITIKDCDFYELSSCIKGEGNGDLNDIWIEGCQFDGASLYDIDIASNTTNTITNLNIIHNYATAPHHFISINVQYNTNLKCVNIANNYINGNDADNATISVDASNYGSVNISNNTLINCKRLEGGVIEVLRSRNTHIINNIFDFDTYQYTDGVVVVSNTVNCIISNNSARNNQATPWNTSTRVTNVSKTGNIPA